MITTGPTRRALLTAFGATGLAAWAGGAALRASQTVPRAQSPSVSAFRGTRAGDERRVQEVGLRWCPPGRFVMGSPTSEVGHRPDEAQVDVTLTRGFWVGTHEVTQRDWLRVMATFPDRPPSSRFGLGDDLPVYWISFDEASSFCAALTRRGHASGDLPAGWTCRLPTEAQWEYACRAGTTMSSAYGDGPTPAQANIARAPIPRGTEPPGSAVRVGSYVPNAWGLHDMHGNVWEWCRDWYHAALPGGTDPDLSTQQGVANRDGTYSRVRRGGAWADEAWACRSACRLRFEPHRRSDHIGFRVVIVES